MKNIALATDASFWEIGLGAHARIRELYHFLACNSHFTLYYLGDEVCPFPGPSFQRGNKQKQLKGFLQAAKHDLLIVEYIHLHWAADFLLKGTKIYLDAIDLFSERTKSFAAYNRSIGSMTFDQEIGYFRKFDKVMFIQKEEMEKVLPHLGEDKLLLCPHPTVPEADAPIREEVQAISFFGSPSWPNVDGIQWFHDAVMPLLGNLGEKCIANGAFSTSPISIFSPRLAKGKVFPFLGDYYKGIDIAINPVLYGSGLKIKSVEAIAYGIPLVSTSAGAQGLLEQAGRSFLLADTPEEFAAAICALAASSGLRRRLSARALEYAQHNLTPQACFKSLIY